MTTSFEDFMKGIEAEALAEGAVRELVLWREFFKKKIAGEKMNSATYAFVYNGSSDWRQSIADDWELDVVELDGTEKIMGHRQIDGSICKILQAANGKLIAVSK